MKKQKIIATIIYGLIILFFGAEMFLKPISGEDAHQAKCVAKAETLEAYNTCIRDSLNYIPRLGQTIHTMTISSFTTLPSLGPDIVFRLIDTFMCIGIIYMIVLLAHGERPKLRYRDAITAALATIGLLFSDFTQMFFCGFSNVHNYVPAVLFALLFFYQWFYSDKILKNSQRRGIHLALFAICAFCFGASLELNPFIAFAMIIGGSIIALVRKVKWKKVRGYLLEHIPALIGIALGFIMQYVIGHGFAATIGRSGNYLSSSKISDLWHDPANAIPRFFGNMVVNYAHYLPYLFIAAIALMVIYRQRHRDTRVKLFSAIIVYALIYIAGCFSFDSIMWRITASVFCLLLVPGTFLISEITAQLNRKWGLTCSIILIVLLSTMSADNIAYHISANATTQDILEQTTSLGCLSIANVKKHPISAKSLFYRFKHPENSFSSIEEDWYNSNYLIDGYKNYIIVDSCQMPQADKENS